MLWPLYMVFAWQRFPIVLELQHICPAACITQDTEGTIWVVWTRYSGGTNCDLHYKTSTDFGLNWSNETQLTTDPSFDLHSSIIQAANGSIWVVWSSYRTGDYEIFCKTSPDYGSTWSAETQLTTDPDFDQSPSIIQATDGSIWVVWRSDRTGNQDDLYFKTSPDYGSAWSSDTQLTNHNDDDIDPSITETDQGRMWVAWSTPRTGEPDFEIFYKMSEVIPVHDVAITNVTPSATNVNGGETITITVVAENQGTESETFEVNCYANSTLIGTQTITLTKETSTTLTFQWVTPNLNGTYVISATATTVPGETLANTDDNTFTDGTVQVVKQPPKGDVDGDGDVDLDDFFALLIAYGTKQGDPDYNPDADINKDGEVGILDLYYVVRDYGDC